MSPRRRPGSWSARTAFPALSPKLVMVYPRLSSTLFLLSLSCSAATSYNDQIAPVLEPYAEGDFERAAEVMNEDFAGFWEIQKDPKAGTVSYDNDAVIWNLERGKVLLDAGLFEESYAAFEDAELILNQDFSERAILSARDAASEAGATLTNQKALPYKGYVSDRVLLNAYKALASLGAGDGERALAEARRVDMAYEDAIKVLELDGEDADAAASENQFTMDISVLENSEDLPQPLVGADAIPAFYHDFVNPFALLVVGIVRQVAANGVEDPEVVFRNLCSLLPDHSCLQEEWKTAQAGIRPSGHVYILHEDGLGPNILSEEMAVPYGLIRSEIPAANDFLATAFLAVPVLRAGTNGGGNVTVMDASGRIIARTGQVAEMGPIAQHEQNIRMPKVLVREAARIVVQEIASHATSEAVADQDQAAQIGVAVLGLLYKAVMNQADDRFWRTLPNAYAFACCQAPAGGEIEIATASGSGSQVVEVDPKGNTLIRIRSVAPGQMSVQAIDLGCLSSPATFPRSL